MMSLEKDKGYGSPSLVQTNMLAEQREKHGHCMLQAWGTERVNGSLSN
jgi:hypothetical protein